MIVSLHDLRREFLARSAEADFIATRAKDGELSGVAAAGRASAWRDAAAIVDAYARDRSREDAAERQRRRRR